MPEILITFGLMSRLAAILLIFACTGVWSQSLDSVLTSTASISDTLDWRVDHQLDSLKSYRALDSIQDSFGNSVASLKYSYDSVTTVADRSITAIQQQLDSLTEFDLPNGHLIGRLDSVQRWKSEKLGTLNEKVNGLRQKAKAKLDSLDLPDELQGKLSELTSVVDNVDLSLPATEIPALQLPSVDLSSLTNTNLSLDVPNLDMPLDQQLPDLNIPNADIPTGELGGIGGEIKQYQDQIGDVVPKNVEDIPSVIEEKAANLDQVGEVQSQLGEVEKVKGLTGNVQDPEAMKEQMVETAKQQAVNHFAGQEEKLQAAMEKIAKYKQKYSSVQSLADLPRKRPNEMRGKPLIERLMPGVALQVHRNDDWLLDFNPYVGYRFNSRLTVGAGWNYRIGFNPDDRAFTTSSRIYGIRSYGEFKIGKGFSGRLEAEYMNTWVPPQFASSNIDAAGREWVFSTMAGMKKEYRFVKNVKGTVFILYNLYDPHHRSPYGDRLNMRFGFEFPMKKSRKPSR